MNERGMRFFSLGRMNISETMQLQLNICFNKLTFSSLYTGEPGEAGFADDILIDSVKFTLRIAEPEFELLFEDRGIS